MRVWQRGLIFACLLLLSVLGLSLARLYFSGVSVRELGGEGLRLRFLLLGGTVLFLFLLRFGRRRNS